MSRQGWHAVTCCLISFGWSLPILKLVHYGKQPDMIMMCARNVCCKMKPPGQDPLLETETGSRVGRNACERIKVHFSALIKHSFV